MIKYREILRLTSLGASQRNVADSYGCARSTVQNVLQTAEQIGLKWPLPEEWDDAAIKQRLYPPKSARDSSKAPISYHHIQSELKKHGVTMSLLWTEYCEDALSAGSQAWHDQEQQPDIRDLSFDERFAMVVDAEWDARRVNKRIRLLRQAELSHDGCQHCRHEVRYR